MKFGNKQYSAMEDKSAQEILDSQDVMEAQEWLQRYTTGLFSSHALKPEDTGETPLAPVVARLMDAGADRLVVHHAGSIFLGLVVVLPADTKARERLFAADLELSQVCLQRAQKDYDQKYLYYSLQ